MNWKSWGLLGCIFVFLVCCNSMVPLYADDYSTSFFPETNQRVTGVVDSIQMAYVFWLTWSGRFFTFTLVEIFLSMDKTIFNIVNSAVCVFLFVLISWISTQSRPSFRMPFSNCLLIMFFFWFGLSTFGECVFWISGTIIYLWATFFVLLFMYPYILAYYDQLSSFADKSIFQFGMFFAGILAGGALENLSTITLLMIGLSSGYFYKIGRLKRWMVYGVVGLFIGWVLLICAPGNFARAEHFQVDFFHRIFNTLNMTRKFLMSQWVVWIATIVALIVIFRRRLQNSNPALFCIGTFFLFGSVASNLVMVASPYFPERTGTVSLVFLIVAAMCYVSMLQMEEIQFGKCLRQVAYLAVCIVLVINMGKAFYNYSILHAESVDRINYILLEKEKGNLDVVVSPYSIHNGDLSGHIFVSDIGVETGDWQNVAVAKYFGLNSIRIERKEK